MVTDIKFPLKEILRGLREWLDIDIPDGAKPSNHVHMRLSVSPKRSPSDVMKILKGTSAEYFGRDFSRAEQKKYSGLHICARRYFVRTVAIDREVIKKYVKEQKDNQISEDQLGICRDSSVGLFKDLRRSGPNFFKNSY